MKKEFPFDQALEYIYSRRKFAKSSSLERISALLSALGDPQDELSFVHVVGTNGKGSTSTMVSSCLTEAGFRVGLFTSPFVLSFLERIQIDSKTVDEDVFLSACLKVKKCSEALEKAELSPTFFETVLAVALVCFRETGCRFVVLEAGMGGASDSTNIIPPPDVTVITSISLDHTEMLGATVKEIATAKCGVIKPGSIVVSFPESDHGIGFAPQSKEAHSVIERKCSEAGVPLIVPEMSTVSDIKKTELGSSFQYKGKNYEIRLAGTHQIANACTAIEAVTALKEKGVRITCADIKNGLKRSFIPGRMERIECSGKTIILDGGHNPGCMNALRSMLKAYFPDAEICAVLGFMKDKDSSGSIEIIAPSCKRIIFTSADSQRGAPPSELAEEGRKHHDYIMTADSAADSIEEALKGNEDVVLVAGSFYLVSDARAYLLSKSNCSGT